MHSLSFLLFFSSSPLFIYFLLSLSLSSHTHIHIAHLFSLPYIHPYITPIPISHTHAHLLEQCFSLFSSSSVHVPLCVRTHPLSPQHSHCRSRVLPLALAFSKSSKRMCKQIEGLGHRPSGQWEGALNLKEWRRPCMEWIK